MDGYIIGASVDTASEPDGYWDGSTFNVEIDSAEFYETLGAARVGAGNLQATYADRHIEAYSSTKTIQHDPPLSGTGI